jgi:DnaJ-class molecular chaperone
VTKSDGQQLGLDPETAQLIESIYRRLDTLDLFTLLDIDINADATRVRRGYFKRSRLFHPDRYFTRDLGEHKHMLEQIFDYTKAAYDFLKDDEQRAAYRREILARREKSSGVVSAGARVVAVKTPGGLKFKIVDEEAFFRSAKRRSKQTFEGIGGQVKLPKKRYALPRIKKPPKP